MKGLPHVVAVCAFLLSAQQPPPPKSQTPPKQQVPTFRSATDVVSTHVRVQDASGRFIPDLQIKDFEVREDGVLQTISHFAPVVGGRVMAEVVKTADAPLREGLILPPPSTRPASPGRIFIIFIDDLHLQPLDTNKAKQVLRQIRDTVLHDDDLVGIVSSGYSSIAVDLSPDTQHLRMNEAIEKVMGAGKTPSEIINTAQTAEGPAGLRADAYTAFKVAYDILAQAEKVTDRRKAFIYVSSGYDFNPFPGARYQSIQDLSARSQPPAGDQGRPPTSTGVGLSRNPFEMNGLQFSQADLARALWELILRARRANVTFYPVDPRGLDAGLDASLSQTISAQEQHDFLNTTLSSLQAVAAGTGGTCICGNNDIKAGLQALDNEMSDYYILGYESNNPDPLKARRHIEIKVTRRGARVLPFLDWYSIKR